MKYIVTGGLGFIGRNIVKELLKSNNEVIVIDDLSNSKITNNDLISFHKTDIRNKNELSSLVKDVDGIFHQASLIDVQESIKNPKLYYDVNVTGSKNIFELAIENEIKVVYASSASVYGDVKNIPIKETNSLNPINPYGETKLEIEKIASSLKIGGLKAIGLRYFNVFGEGQSSSYAGVITKFFQNLKKGIQPVIFGNGLQIRDFIFVEDIVNANLSAMNKIDSGIFNVGSGKGIQILELANYMIDSFGFDFSPIFDSPLKNDIKQSVADISLIQETLDWNPKTSIHDWITTNV